MSSCSKTTAVEFRSYEPYRLQAFGFTSHDTQSAQLILTPGFAKGRKHRQLATYMPRVPPLKSGVLTGQIRESSLLTLLLFHAEANQPDQFGGSYNRFTEVNSDTNHQGFNKLAPVIIMGVTITYSCGDAYYISPWLLIVMYHIIILQ